MANTANYVITDVETGGLIPDIRTAKDKDKGKPANPITQVAFLTIDSINFKELNRFETFVKPYENLVITKEALASTMLSMSDILKGMDYKKLIKFVIEYLKQATNGTRKPILIGHNINFDIGFYAALFRYDNKNFYDYIDDGVPICTLRLAKAKWDAVLAKEDVKKITLTHCCKLAGIKLTDAHGAMNDVLATTKLVTYFFNLLRNDSSNVLSTVKEQKIRDTFEL